jgi:hypothetical protein
MSRASKIFFAGSCALTAGTIWAVHHIQVTEQAVSIAVLLLLENTPRSDQHTNIVIDRTCIKE